MNHDIEKALDNLEKRAQDIQHYMNIMSKVKTVNVADDQDFQREFDFFYKVRRNAEWRKVFFEIFERKKKKNCSYKEIITELYEGTGQVEASFASKMLASIDENMPIWDSKVLDRIGIKSSNKRGQQKLEETIELYDVIVQWYSDLKANKASYNEYITSFDSRFPDYSSISDTKKIDFILWAMGEEKEDTIPSVYIQNMEALSDAAKIASRSIEAYPGVVSAEANKEMLETVPHQNMEDMAVVYCFVLNSNDEGRASILVTNQLIENMGVTPEQLHADAMENAPKIKPVEIKGMSEVMAEMMGFEQAEMMGIFPVALEDEKIYVATVPDKVHGAGVLAYQDFMEQAAERAGGDFYVLPSSLHEVLIVPDNGEMGLKDLEAMVKEVNATQVAPADKLTDSVYHYDSQAKIFELGEKFVARQAEKEEEDAEEKGEKSVLGELKAKKEEVAKAPKKENIDKGAKAKGGEAL